LPYRSLFAIIPLQGRAAEKKNSWLFLINRSLKLFTAIRKGFSGY